MPDRRWPSAWGSDRFDVHSAGVVAIQVHPLAVRAMAELGIDISGQSSKTIRGIDGQQFEYAVTVCDDAKGACPYFPGAQRQLHWSFDDPSAATGAEQDRLGVFRRVRDQIADRIRAELLGGAQEAQGRRQPE